MSRRARFRIRSMFAVMMASLLTGCQGGGCSGPTVLSTSTLTSDHLVLTGRQKFIGLAAYIPGVEYDDLVFSIVQQPGAGTLTGTPPNLCYVPNVGFAGSDSFVYDATGGGQTIRQTVTLQVTTNYILPIGIPAPEFGIEHVHTMYSGATFDFGGGPEPYRNAGSGPYTHYVDFGSGNDSGNPFGTADAPRKTIPDNLPAGSVVELHGEGYDDRPRWFIRGNGTADRPIFVRGASPLAKAVLRRPFTIECSYLIVENLEFDAQDFVTGMDGPTWINLTETTDPVLQTFHHVAIRHLLIRDQPTHNAANPQAIFFHIENNAGSPNNDTDLLQHLVVYDVEIRNFSQWNDFSGTLDYGGVHFASNTKHGWLLDSHIHHVRGDACGISRTNGLSNQGPAKNIYVARNYFHNFKENCVDVKLAVDCVLSQNVMHTVRESDSSNGDAVIIQNSDATGAYPASDNIWVIFNRIYDAERGIMHASSDLPDGKPSRSYLIGNLLHDIRVIRGAVNQRGVAIEKSKFAQSRIVNNTISACDHGIWLGLAVLTDPDKSTAVVRNNIISDLSEKYMEATGQDPYQILHQPNESIPFTQIDHNLDFESIGNVRFGVAGPGNSSGNYVGLAALQENTPFGDDSLQSDPRFVNPAGRDFHLMADSPCIGAGTTDEAYSLFPAAFGRSIDFYQDGTSRQLGSVHIGALPPK